MNILQEIFKDNYEINISAFMHHQSTYLPKLTFKKSPFNAVYQHSPKAKNTLRQTPDMDNDIPVDPHQEIGAQTQAHQFRNGEGPPDQIHIAA